MGMQQNILHNSTRSLDARLYNDEYFDFMLYRGDVASCSDANEQMIADFSTMNFENGKLYSTATWDGAVNNGVEMKDIGFTGYDNGLLRFSPGYYSNKELLELMLNSEYSIPSGDTRFFMTPVNGSTGKFKYDIEFDDEENVTLEDIDKLYNKFIDEENKVAYVGLTANKEERHNSHKTGIFREKRTKSVVFDYFTIISKDVPDPIYLEEGLSLIDSQDKEDYYRNLYEKMGYRMLNTAKTGIGIGSTGFYKWNKKRRRFN